MLLCELCERMAVVVDVRVHASLRPWCSESRHTVAGIAWYVYPPIILKNIPRNGWTPFE